MSNEPTVKRWTAKRKATVVMDIFKGKTTVTEVNSPATSPLLRSKAGFKRASVI